MEKSKRNVAFLILSLIIIIFPQIVISTVALEQEKQPISHKFREMYGLVTSSSMASWQKLKSLVNDAQKQFFPPNIDFRPKVEEEVDEEGAKEWMKEAVKKSLDSSKSAVEGTAKSAASAVGETAKSAASAVGDVVHNTKEKVSKKQCTGDACSHDEL